MRPVLFEIFGLQIHAYGTMLAIAFLAAIWGVSRSAKSDGISLDTIIDLAIWVIIGAIVGARVAFVATEFQYFRSAPWWSIFMINNGGLAFHGGLIGGFLAGLSFLLVKKIYPWKLADHAAPFIALGYSIVRIGCFLKGCCYGKVTGFPLALRCAASDNALRHPTQLYSMIGSLALFFILWRFRKHNRFPGFLFLLYIGLYSILRFIVEYFRETPPFLPWLSLAQLVCVLMAIVGFGSIFLIQWRLKQKGIEGHGLPERNTDSQSHS